MTEWITSSDWGKQKQEGEEGGTGVKVREFDVGRFWRIKWIFIIKVLQNLLLNITKNLWSIILENLVKIYSSNKVSRIPAYL